MISTSYNNGSTKGFNPFKPDGTPNSVSHQELVHEAVVVDVIVNDSHPDYMSDGYNVGAIKFRALKSDMFKEDEKLHWALPIESNITDYPLLNEVVIVQAALNRFYYTRKLNVSSKVTSHAFFGLNEEMSPMLSKSKKSESYRKHSFEKKDVGTTKSLGKSFKDLKGVYRLRSDEGDIIFEGRSGQSIRFGAAFKDKSIFKSQTDDQAPNIILRSGPFIDAQSTLPEFGLVNESIDKDKSSIYLVSDQTIPLTLATINASNHAKSIHDFPALTGAQIAINSDRLILNARNDKLLGFASKGIHWGSAIDFTVDTDRNYESSITQDELITVGRDETLNIGRNTSETVGGKAEVSVAESKTVKIGKDYATEIGAGQTFKVGKASQFQIGTSSTFKVGTSYSLNAGTSIKVDAGTTLALSATAAATIKGVTVGLTGATSISLGAPVVTMAAGPMVMTMSGAGMSMGSKDGPQKPMVLGDDLATFLGNLIDVFIQEASTFIPATSAPGAPSAMSPGIVAGLQQLKSDVAKGKRASFNSKVASTN